MTYKLLGANGEIYVSAVPGLFGGNGRQKIYGRLTCASATRAVSNGNTYRTHRVFFADETAAVAAGYRPCGNCMREEYQIWKARRPLQPLPARDQSAKSAVKHP